MNMYLAVGRWLVVQAERGAGRDRGGWHRHHGWVGYWEGSKPPRALKLLGDGVGVSRVGAGHGVSTEQVGLVEGFEQKRTTVVQGRVHGTGRTGIAPGAAQGTRGCQTHVGLVEVMAEQESRFHLSRLCLQVQVGRAQVGKGVGD